MEPRNGVGWAFDIEFSVVGREVQMEFEIYMWPYGNAGVSVSFAGTPDSVTPELIGGVLAAVDGRVEAAGEVAAGSGERGS